MRLGINRSQLNEMITQGSSFYVNAVKDQITDLHKERFSRKLLEIAAPMIQAHLRNASNLPTRNGLKQFYDTESINARRGQQDHRQKARKPIKSKNKAEHDHLLHQWEVGFSVGRGGHGTIVVDNPKEVSSGDGSRTFSLFKLLWEGTETYVVPATLTKQETTNLFRRYGRDAYYQWLSRHKENQTKLGKDYNAYKRELIKNVRGQIGSVPKKKTEMEIEKEKYKMMVNGAGFGRGGLKPIQRLDDVNVFSVGAEGESRTTVSTTPGQTKVFLGKTKYVFMDPKPFADFAAENAPKRMNFYNRFKGKFYYNVYARQGIKGEVVKDFHTYVSESVFNGLMSAVGEMTEARNKQAMLTAFGQEEYV
jgi:hypothetical protein